MSIECTVSPLVFCSVAPVNCAPGYYSLQNAYVCIECPPGYECRSPDVMPTLCTAGSYSTGGLANCTVCAAGFACPSTTTGNNMYPCPLGKSPKLVQQCHVGGQFQLIPFSAIPFIPRFAEIAFE